MTLRSSDFYLRLPFLSIFLISLPVLHHYIPGLRLKLHESESTVLFMVNVSPHVPMVSAKVTEATVALTSTLYSVSS